MKATFKTVRPDHWRKAQSLRRPMTAPEKVLWEAIRAGKLGPRFRRQHPIGPYIVDFCCTEAHLVIEVDGDQHSEPDAEMHDFQRSGYLGSLGYEVLRYSNRAVLRSTSTVLDDIRARLQAAPRGKI